MSAIFKYLQEFYRKEFKLSYFFVIACLLGFYIYLNYWHGLERLLTEGKTRSGAFVGYYLLYFIPFASAFLLQLIFYNNCTYYKNKWFWIILLLSPAFFSFRVNFYFHEQLIDKVWKADAAIFWRSSLNWVVRIFVVLIPVFIIWLLKDRHNQPFYGSSTLKSVKPYLIMLLIMIPFIALASTQEDFLQTYPKAKVLDQLDLSPRWLHYIFYELCYGFDFISIEFFFRGFLILSMARICGPHCIIPVACFYCSIHFGKPIGEAISSFLGGLLLGIISYNTKSIWGGLIAHLGIAWLMEAGSWLGLLFKK